MFRMFRSVLIVSVLFLGLGTTAEAQSSTGTNAVKASADDKATAAAYAVLGELPFAGRGGGARSVAFTVNKTNGFHEWASHSTSYFGTAGIRFALADNLSVSGRILSDVDPGGTGAQAVGTVIEADFGRSRFQFHASAARSLNNTSAPGVDYVDGKAVGNVTPYGVNGSDYVLGMGIGVNW